MHSRWQAARLEHRQDIPDAGDVSGIVLPIEDAVNGEGCWLTIFDAGEYTPSLDASDN